MMKKAMIILFVLALLPSITFAQTTIDKDTPATLGTEIFRVSNNVELQVISTSADYAATSAHLQGNKQFGTTSLQNMIFEADKTAGSFDDFSAPSSATALDSSVFTSFSSADDNPDTVGEPADPENP